MKYLTWTLHTPSNYNFTQWMDLDLGEPWYSTNWVKVGEDSIRDNWDYRQKGFFDQITNNTDKIYAIGMHELTLDENGNILDLSSWNGSPSGANPLDYKVLNSDESDIGIPLKKSLLYFMQTHPEIKWSLQVLCTKEKVEKYLDTPSLVDEFLRQYKKILEIYIQKGFPIRGAEIDFEKTTTRFGIEPGNNGVADYTKFAAILSRVKNEVCIPLGLELRVNLFAMTGDYTPSYYAWHDYRTMAGATDMNGNQAVDEFQLMTYDFSWGGSAPGPSTPLWWLKKVLDHVKDALPANKTFIGNAGYGRRWPLYNQRYGTTLDYKSLMLLQNGMYIHNDGADAPDGNFYFADQDFIPFCGFNDPESDYQICYPHTYDRFKAQYGSIDLYEGEPSVNEGVDSEYVTNYSKDQHPIFTGVKAVLNSGTLSGNTGDGSVYSKTLSESLDQPYTFDFYKIYPKQWIYDPNTGSCVLESGNAGIDGSCTYTFNIPAGSYKVIAYVGFPYFGADHFDISINGTTHTVGGGIPDWYPHITNPAVHLWDCGQWNLNDSNTITVGVTNEAWIGGFIICDGFDPNMRGGSINFPFNLQVMKKRGNKKLDDNGAETKISEIIDAQFPTQMIVTGETLRRPPRPAIIWEDMFGPHLNGNGFIPGYMDGATDLTRFPFYLKADSYYYDEGAGTSIMLDSDGKQVCTNGYSPAGFSWATWTVFPATDTEAAYAACDAVTDQSVIEAQLVLNKKFSQNISVEADVKMERDLPQKVGLRILAKLPGEVGDSYLFVADWEDYTIKLYVEDENGVRSTVVDPIPMTDPMKLSKNDRSVFKAHLVNGKLSCYIGDQLYFDQVILPSVTPGAFGVYVSETYMKVYRLTISSLDRFEPMEKMTVLVDGQAYPYGEVERTVGYDEFGYLIYTGYPGNQTVAVRSIPSDPDTVDPATVEGRAGTIFETEVTAEKWSLDYKNLQLATVPSWVGKKDVKILMDDPGIWLRTLYIGDQQGYSVSFNSDRTGFIKTTDMIMNYRCAGLAMWTLGQEDPMIFDYIEKIR